MADTSQASLDEAQIIAATERIDFAKIQERLREADAQYERSKRGTKFRRIVVTV